MEERKEKYTENSEACSIRSKGSSIAEKR